MFNLFKSQNIVKDYRYYRWFYTSEGKLVVGGKSDGQNELVIKNFLKPGYTIMHTSEPGSGFMIIQDEDASEKDINECAVFCACFSKQWKNIKSAKSKVEVDIFKGEQVYKSKAMKTGTFGIKGEQKSVKVKPELVLVIQKGKFRAVPDGGKDEVLVEIKPGKMSKEDASEKIAKKIKREFQLPVSKEEIMQAIPSDKLSVK